MLKQIYVMSRPQKLYVICTVIFLTVLVIAEATASKFFTAFQLPLLSAFSTKRSMPLS